MRLPFSEADFFEVFGAYNRAFWPLAAALWLVTFAAPIQLLRGRWGSRALVGLLAFHWAWSGIAYHALFFARINPAARIFAVLFVLQAVLLLWFGLVRKRVAFDVAPSPRHYLGGALVAYSLIYPGLVLLGGQSWPNAPTFGVPCPSTLFTAGVLLAAMPPIPKWLFVVPVLWTVLGGSAALLLSVRPDLMLFVAGASMLLYALAPNWLAGSRAA